jgi:hypothetical protein
MTAFVIFISYLTINLRKNPIDNITTITTHSLLLPLPSPPPYLTHTTLLSPRLKGGSKKAL